MGDISASFSRREFACHCGCGFDTVDVELIYVLQEVRDHYGAVVTINSGSRCFEHNMSTPGAARDSQHMQAKAADFSVAGVSPQAVYDYLDKKYPNKYGVGLYQNRVHVDVRSKRARWKVT